MGPSADSSAALVRLETGGDVVRLVLVVAVTAALAAFLRWRAGIGDGRAELTAIARGTVQLAIVGLLIALVLGSWPGTLAFAGLMVGVAGWTSGRRMRVTRPWLVLGAIALGALPVTGALLGVGLLPLEPVALVPTAGILIGSAMSAATLAGRRALDSLRERRGEVEAGLSIGLLPRDAHLLVARDEARLAFLPGLDQTRTVGLVTLPGAFVGALLGGASPMQASALQLVVLAGILLVQSIAVVVVLELVVRGHLVRR